MSSQANEQRIMELMAFIVGCIQAHVRQKVVIWIDGEEFGISSVEALRNPRGPIPEPPIGGVQVSEKNG